MRDALEQSIHKTLAYFDQFNYPLTMRELYKWLWQPPAGLSFSDFEEALADINGIEEKHGFVFLSGREETVQSRLDRVAFAQKKLRVARRGVWMLQWVPFVRAVFVCNTIALGTAGEDSDIDLYIAVRKGRLWFARFLVTFVLSVTGLRRHGLKVANRLCLSFYVTDDHLDLSDVAIEQPDVYLIYWLATLMPMYDPDNMIDMIATENAWAAAYIPHAFESKQMSTKTMVRPSLFQYAIKRTLEMIHKGNVGDLKESMFRWLQVRRMQFTKGSIRDLPDTRVVITDQMLKFHENDRRQQFKDVWMKRIEIGD